MQKIMHQLYLLAWLVVFKVATVYRHALNWGLINYKGGSREGLNSSGVSAGGALSVIRCTFYF